jgi:hypothetical protein
VAAAVTAAVQQQLLAAAGDMCQRAASFGAGGNGAGQLMLMHNSRYFIGNEF